MQLPDSCLKLAKWVKKAFGSKNCNENDGIKGNADIVMNEIDESRRDIPTVTTHIKYTPESYHGKRN